MRPPRATAVRRRAAWSGSRDVARRLLIEAGKLFLLLLVADERVPADARPRELDVCEDPQPQSTLALMGFSRGSNASSVIEKLVRSTGTTLDCPHTSSAGPGRPGSPAPALLGLVLEPLRVARGRVHEQLQGGQRRVQPVLGHGRVLVRVLELVGGVELDREADRLDRRPLYPQGLLAWPRLPSRPARAPTGPPACAAPAPGCTGTR